MEVDLDLARNVVVGRLTRIDEPGVDRGDGVRWAQARVEVTEILKGLPCRSIDFRAVTFVASNWRGPTPLATHKVGDSGIWVLTESDGILSDTHFLPESRRQKICEMLTMLSERKWSTPVNGLQAWAGVVRPEDRNVPVIIFAVKNVTKQDLFIPIVQCADFVGATVVGVDGRTTEYSFGVVGRGSETVFSRRLPAGRTAYLHPELSCIDLVGRHNLPPGDYTVVIRCQNEKRGRISSGSSGKIKEVDAWTGSLKAPAIQFACGPDETGVAQTR
jgi:hypothetical protein